MTGIIICGFLFFFMLAAPLVGAYCYYKKSRMKVLYINQEKTRDARYFGKSFSTLVENRLAQAEGNIINLSRKEVFIDADTQKVYPEEVGQIVIAREKDFHVPPNVKIFDKEIYAAKNFFSARRELWELRAACSRGKMVISDNTNVIRWVDSDRTLAVYDGCDLGLSASAKQRMSVGCGCVFHRLYAPEIYLGQYPDSLMDEKEGKDPRIYRMGVQKEQWQDIRYISGDMINEDGVVDFSVVSQENLEVLENLIVNGDIRSHKGVRLYDGAVVCGNIFAEYDVHLGRHSCVLGNIFTQGSIYFEEGAAAGQRTRICSVIAREGIQFEKNTFVFGYIDCEAGGIVLGSNEERGEGVRTFQYLEETKNQTERHLRFSNLEDYENVDKQGFRFFREMQDAVIPDGAKRIPDSMFYGCSGLEFVELPDTVEEIGDYAFAGCKNLKGISWKKLQNLKSIGVSAFENCEKLDSVFLPDSLEWIGGAAFGGCTSVTRVAFGEKSHVVKLPDHCFKDCSSLREIVLPIAVREFGVSAFAGCPVTSKIQVTDTTQKVQGEEEHEA